MKSKLSISLLVIGIIIALLAAFFMIFDILPLPARITILIVGIALIGASSFNLLK
jgi:hypothetical protein